MEVRIVIDGGLLKLSLPNADFMYTHQDEVTLPISDKTDLGTYALAELPDALAETLGCWIAQAVRDRIKDAREIAKGRSENATAWLQHAEDLEKALG